MTICQCVVLCRLIASEQKSNGREHTMQSRQWRFKVLESNNFENVLSTLRRSFHSSQVWMVTGTFLIISYVGRVLCMSTFRTTTLAVAE